MSVLEIAAIEIDTERSAEFEEVFENAVAFVRAAEGHLGSRLMADVERPGHYVFLVTWREIGDHTERFVSSPGFHSFDELIGPFLVTAPQVSHVASAFGGEVQL
ncbi:MAG: antibiotic biosynthesis monooxygenase [Microbacteriaceae bacterium]|nr:antibiotic biosynthesis monooxygenase [Microbacteriaceae bacterium]